MTSSLHIPEAPANTVPISTPLVNLSALQLLESGVPRTTRHMYEQYAVDGQFDTIKSSIMMGIEYDQYLHSAAAYVGDHRILEFLSTLHPVHTWNSYVTFSAARGQKWTTLQWLIDNGCPVCKRAIVETGKHGNLEVVEQLCRQYPNLQFDSGDTAEILVAGHVIVNNWLEQKQNRNRFEWDEALNYIFAASEGSMEIIQWLYFKGYKWKPTAPITALRSGHIDIFEWFESHRPIEVSGPMVMTLTSTKSSESLKT
jgi:hypothetical protein